MSGPLILKGWSYFDRRYNKTLPYVRFQSWILHHVTHHPLGIRLSCSEQL
jgi:hypothetical protein